MSCQINNKSDMDIGELSPLIDDLVSHIKGELGFKAEPAITLQDDPDNAGNTLGKTAFYSPADKVITIYVTSRHPKDIMRSIAHETVHHAQNERGEFDNISEMGEGYAQNDEHLRNMEKEAYLKGNMCFRDWEDGHKRQMMESIHRQNSFKRRNNTMKIHKWKNNELNRLLMEKFGFGEGQPAEDEWSKKQEIEENEDPEQQEEEEETVEENKGGDMKAAPLDMVDNEEDEEEEEQNESFRAKIRGMVESMIDSGTEAALNDPAVGQSAELGILMRQKQELEATSQGIGQDPNHPLNDVYYAIEQAIRDLEGQ